MRSQLAAPNKTVAERQAYNDLFTLHGTTMIFLFNTPVLAGFGNFLLPLQIGVARHGVPPPQRVRLLGLRACPACSSTAACSSATSRRGLVRLCAADLVDLLRGIGLDFWALAVIFVGISSTIGGMNFVVTTFNCGRRA